MSFLRRIFEQPDVERRLSWLRISLGAIIAVLITFGPYGGFYTDTAAFLYEPGPLLPFLPVLSAEVFYLLRGVVILSALLFAGGLWLRLSAPILALSFFVFNYYVSRFAGAQWSYNVHLNLFLFLWWISLHKGREQDRSSSSRYRSSDASGSGSAAERNGETGNGEQLGGGVRGSFALGFMQLYVAMLYFQTGISKLLNGGLRWFLEGDTIYTNALLLGGSRGAFFAQYEWIFPVVGVATALFELGFLPAYLLGLRRMLCVAGILFHLGIFLMLGISFWHLWLLYPALFWVSKRPAE